MATNLGLDDRLINEALKAGHHKSKKEAVTQALQAYIQSFQQREAVSFFGKIKFDPEYDYKKGRSR